MDSNNSLNQSRRQFVKFLSAGTLVCLGCGHLCALAGSQQKLPSAAAEHKFKAASNMTFEETFMAAYQAIVPIMNVMAEKIGREKFLDMMKEASSVAAARQAAAIAGNSSDNSLASFISPFTNPDYFWKHVLTVDIVQNKPEVFEVKIDECIWARTFQALQATDIGYAMLCHADFAMAPAFNPKMKLTRTKTLMQGHGCCNHHWEVTG